MKSADLLIEVGTEELPPKSLKSLSEAFESLLRDGLTEARLVESPLSTRFATPRRLAVHVEAVASRQPDLHIQKQGPLVSAAFDDQGNPTQAAEGFARSCGVPVDELERIDSDKGEKLAFKVHQPGRSSDELIPEILHEVLGKLPVAKRMRWGDGEAEFVRPVQWLVVKHGERSLDCKVYGVASGTHSRGHRFHHDKPVEISNAQRDDYVRALREAKVIASFARRRDEILTQVNAVAESRGGRAVLDDALLDEVTALVEWPVALAGDFDEKYLDVPHEALIYTMKDNQKYFPLVDGSGQLLPGFITISNVESKDPSQVVSGNEKVVEPRLADAAFFWEQDQKKSLEEHLPALANIVFQKQLGTLADKTERLKALSVSIAEPLGLDISTAERAATLSKCDLMTDMVGEFPAMQGIAGRYYAAAAGEPEAVSTALEQYYWPKFSGDALPDGATAQCLALADRIDTLTGIFGIGQKPTGSKDPFALRRAALAVLRILIENRLPLDLRQLILASVDLHGKNLTNERVVDDTFEYCIERLAAYYQERKIGQALFDAVRTQQPTSPLDFDRRIHAVQAFSEREEAVALAAANKRIANILKQRDSSERKLQIDPGLLSDPAETALYEAMGSVSDSVKASFSSGDYESGLLQLVALREPVDRFFDEVMVMDENAETRANRIALLDELRQLFLRVADLSVLHG